MIFSVTSPNCLAQLLIVNCGLVLRICLWYVIDIVQLVFAANQASGDEGFLRAGPKSTYGEFVDIEQSAKQWASKWNTNNLLLGDLHCWSVMCYIVSLETSTRPWIPYRLCSSRLSIKYLNLRACVVLQILLVLQYDERRIHVSTWEVLAPSTLLMRALSTSDPPDLIPLSLNLKVPSQLIIRASPGHISNLYKSTQLNVPLWFN